MRTLYDTSGPIALLDKNNVAHQAVATWHVANMEQGWLSCPITQNGCLRILSQPSYANPVSVAEAFELLQSAVPTEHHQFVPDDISLLDDTLVDTQRLSGHGQLTDVYLLALAASHDARLVTLDTRISLTAVHGANESHLVVI